MSIASTVYAETTADRVADAIEYVRSLNWLFGERDTLVTELDRAFAEGEAAALDDDCGHDDRLARDVHEFLAELLEPDSAPASPRLLGWARELLDRTSEGL